MNFLRTAHFSTQLGQLAVASVFVLAVACVVVCARAVPATAQGRLSDLAILSALQLDDPATSRLVQSRRTQITPDLDLVVAFGGKPPSPREQSYPQPMRIGLFVQERDQPSRVYKLMTEGRATDAQVRIERVTASDLVLSYTEEKSQGGQREKFLFDVRAKALVGHFTYEPWFMGTAFTRGTRTLVPVTNRDRVVVVEVDAASEPKFKVLTDGDAQPWLKHVPVRESEEGIERRRVLYFGTDAMSSADFGTQSRLRIAERLRYPNLSGERIQEVEEVRSDGLKRYPLPQSTTDELRAARPGLFEDGFQDYGIDERIGAWDVENGRLWIGKSFYDGEGGTGVGGFGWFDEATRSFRIMSPPEVRNWSITALHVEKDAVWMALARHGEWGDSSGGVARYDRLTKEIRLVPHEDIGKQFLRVGDRLLLVSGTSMALVTADGVRSYFVDRMSDGRLRVAEAVAAESFGWWE